MKKIFLAAFFSLAITGGLRAQEGAAADPYREAFEKIAELTNMQQSVKAMIPQLFEMIGQQFPGVPGEFWESAEKKFLAQAMDETQRIMLPLYKEYFALEDLNELIRFYESPTGRKMTAVMPEITRRNIQGGQQWGMRIFQELMAEMQKKGYTPEM